MKRRSRGPQGIANQLFPAICTTTFVTSFGPYVSTNYFPITILFFLLIIVFLEIYNRFSRHFFSGKPACSRRNRGELAGRGNNNNNNQWNKFRKRSSSSVSATNKRRRHLTLVKKESVQKWTGKRKFQSMKIMTRHNQHKNDE